MKLTQNGLQCTLRQLNAVEYKILRQKFWFSGQKSIETVVYEIKPAKTNCSIYW
jgi:hypothetical protein